MLSVGFGLVKSLKDIREAREPTAVSQIAEAIRTGTTAQGVVVAFGQDWSSELPYFSGRRAVMIPDWASDEVLASLAADDAALGGCRWPHWSTAPARWEAAPDACSGRRRSSAAAAGGQKQEIGGCEVWLHR